MSLSVALTSAMNSLLTIEQQMAATSDNISNANTTGYTEKTVDVAAEYTAGVGTGVTATGTETYIDSYLSSTIASQTSTASLATTLSDYFHSLQQVMGDVSSSSTSTSGNDIASDLTTLSTDLTSLSDDPTSTSLKTQMVSGLSQFADDLQSLSTQVQSLRQQSEDQIATTVTTANTQLDTIQKLNSEITVATASGQSTTDLQDQRLTALNTLAGAIGINYYTDGTGETQIYSKSGQPLLVGETVNHLTHTENSGMSSQTSYANGAIDGITVNGTDITDTLESGTLAGLVQMRDTVLTNVQSELDTLASSVSTTFNTIANSGSTAPPPQTLTGTGSFTLGTDLSIDSGTTVQLAVTDSSGDVTASVNVDLSGDGTVGDVINTLNSALSSTDVTASLNGSGNLVLSAASSSEGVAIGTLSGSVGGADVSSYFGLNDIFVNGSSAAGITVKSSLAATPTLLTTGTLSGTTVGASAVASGDSTVLTKLSTALSATQTFSASGYLGTSASSFEAYAANILGDVSTRYESASSTATTQSSTLSTLQDSFSNETGVNVDSETAKLSELQTAYEASSQIVSTAKAMFSALLTAMQAS